MAERRGQQRLLPSYGTALVFDPGAITKYIEAFYNPRVVIRRSDSSARSISR